MHTLSTTADRKRFARPAGLSRITAALGLAAFALVFALALAGCGGEDSDDDSGKDKQDSALNGTWVSGSGTEITLNNGALEASNGSSPMAKGTYTANAGKITSKSTHIYGGMFDDAAAQMGLDSKKWYSKDELKAAIKVAYPSLTDDQFEEQFASAFVEQTADYTVNGDTLVMTIDGQATTYTRKK